MMPILSSMAISEPLAEIPCLSLAFYRFSA